MQNECAFSKIHPLPLFMWFVSVISFTVLAMNPIIVIISFIGAVAHRILVSKKISVKSIIGNAVFMMMITIINPLFSHHGVTELFFLGGLPVTLEALIFGFFMSIVIQSSILWCLSMSECMTSDKIIHLIGKIFPKIAVLISLILRFIPLMKDKYKRIIDSQTALGEPISYLSAFSVLVSIFLEDSIDTADSMKSRGAELKNRTNYSNFKFSPKDFCFLIFDVIICAVIIISIKKGCLNFSFYPSISEIPTENSACFSYIMFAILAFVPAAVEVIFWTRFVSISSVLNIPMKKQKH